MGGRWNGAFYPPPFFGLAGASAKGGRLQAFPSVRVSVEKLVSHVDGTLCLLSRPPRPGGLDGTFAYRPLREGEACLFSLRFPDVFPLPFAFWRHLTEALRL